MKRITKRDAEVLRTISRLHVVSSRSLMGSCLFSHVRVCQRRLAVLRDHGLICRHQRGLPDCGQGGPVYYRLTARGAELVSVRFEQELQVLERAAKVSRLSLRNHEHHDLEVQVYLSLIAGSTIAEVSQKASSVTFGGDHDVGLVLQTGTSERTLFPDMTLMPREGNVRLFVELDRSSTPHRRIRSTARQYERYCGSGADEALFGAAARRSTYVVYLARSRRRRDNLRKSLAGARTQTVSMVVHELSEGINWLHKAIHGGPAPDPAQAIVRSTQEASAMDVLGSVYADYQALLSELSLPAPDSLTAAYELLCRRAA